MKLALTSNPHNAHHRARIVGQQDGGGANIGRCIGADAINPDTRGRGPVHQVGKLDVQGWVNRISSVEPVVVVVKLDLRVLVEGGRSGSGSQSYRANRGGTADPHRPSAELETRCEDIAQPFAL
jgi:hypothetical protein